MEHLTQIAKAYYKNSSWELNKEAHKLFNSLDGDGDGRVNKDDFVSLMSKHAVGRYMSSPAWFDLFDTDSNGKLTFWEVATILYIVKSGRPLCDACKTLCTATYFTCLHCPDFDLCFACYEKGNSGHDNHHQFLDNYTLLTLHKTSLSNHANTTTGSSNNNRALLTVNKRSDTTTVSSTNTQEKALFALKAVEIGLNIANNCTTM